MEMILLALVLLVSRAQCQTTEESPAVDNTTGKDMYVIHAMVYQVGILTNSTDEKEESNLGNEEALTFYHTNGSNLDLSKIPKPLLTNITSQSMVGVAPKQGSGLPQYFTDSKVVNTDKSSPAFARFVRRIMASNDNTPTLNKEDTLVKILNGTAVIPQEGSVQSLAIPPLLTLNNNLSHIPVPIPNTSIVQYAKISTVIKPTNETQ